MTTLSRARLVAVLAPTLLLGGALLSQYGFGLVPCEMCLWQRWPHLAAILLALGAIAMRGNVSISRSLVVLAAMAMFVSGAIGAFHAGVEWRWWPGPAHCTATLSGGGDMLARIMATPLVRCDQAQWRLAGISLAGWNAILSFADGIAAIVLARRR